MPGRPTLTLRHGCGVVLIVVAALAAACGGTDDLKLPGPDAPTGPLTKVQYTAQANEICRATTKAIAERTEQVGAGNLDATDGGDRQKLKEAVEPVTTLALTRLRNLTPPPADAALVRRGIDAMQASVDALGTDPQAPIDPVGLRQPELFDYGLTGCFTN
jgi:hypothetical protein